MIHENCSIRDSLRSSEETGVFLSLIEDVDGERLDSPEQERAIREWCQKISAVKNPVKRSDLLILSIDVAKKDSPLKPLAFDLWSMNTDTVECPSCLRSAFEFARFSTHRTAELFDKICQKEKEVFERLCAEPLASAIK